MIYELKNERFWLDEVADEVLAYAKDTGISDIETLTCAAGMTPSCPIHFGIFREVAISSFVADELRRRGRRVRLVYYWDDFDHFCKVPYYTTREKIEAHVGKPLCEVPDFNGNYASYGEHYMRDFEKDLHTLGFFPDYNYQSQLYSTGYYKIFIRRALKSRLEIFDIINESKKPYSQDMLAQREAYYPLEVYCEKCRRDAVTTVSYDEEADTIDYVCRKCGHHGSYIIGKNFFGKLIWKANWAARWTDDKVICETSGENQLTDLGSYAVSSKIAERLFDGKTPFSLLYRFIGIPGTAKVSRAQGVKTHAHRLSAVLEPAVFRWVLLKNPPNKPFSIDIEDGIFRLYHEWDTFNDKVKSGTVSDIEKRICEYALQGVYNSSVIVSFKVLTVALSIANGDEILAASLLLRITEYEGTAEQLLIAIRPRMNAARAWLYDYGHNESEPQLRTTFNKDAWDSFSEDCKKVIGLIVIDLYDLEHEADIQYLLYSAPKKLLDIPLEDTKNPAAVALQKEVFAALYQLLLGTDKGPKLSTLLCLLDKAKIKTLVRGVRNVR